MIQYSFCLQFELKELSRRQEEEEEKRRQESIVAVQQSSPAIRPEGERAETGSVKSGSKSGYLFKN